MADRASVHQLARSLLSRITDEGASLTLEVADQRVTVPDDLAEQLLRILDLASSNPVLDIDVLPEMLTTGQAADILGVSRPTVVSLIDSGQLHGERVGSHRRVQTIDLLEFQAKRGIDRRAQLRELTQLSEELGLYDD